MRGCGADEVVIYSQDSWGDPVDLVLDGVGGDLVQRGVDALSPHGRLVAFSAGGGTVDAGSSATAPAATMAAAQRVRKMIMSRMRRSGLDVMFWHAFRSSPPSTLLWTARAGGQPPTWMPGRRSGSGSWLRMISRVTGAVSPRPRRK
ncbi:zinc-binding dehydrogenase [Streptomyces sp. NRRL F-2580]|uniref:zinc-binding dehydrogenase n=1 Tax=Streptomyces sp. NRRL F-2580 TaxID=1463841 RepID=UPI003B635D7D